MTGVGWVGEWASSLRAGGAGQLVRLTERLRGHDQALLREAVISATVGVSNAMVCLREIDRLVPRLCPEAVPTVWEALLDLASHFGPREIRAVRPRLLAEYGAEGEPQVDHDLATRRMALSQPYDQGDGTFDYGLGVMSHAGRAHATAAQTGSTCTRIASPTRAILGPGSRLRLACAANSRLPASGSAATASGVGRPGHDPLSGGGQPRLKSAACLSVAGPLVQSHKSLGEPWPSQTSTSSVAFRR
jgi:hypothetical protein